MKRLCFLILLILAVLPVNAMAFNNDEDSDITPFFELVKEDALKGESVPVITSPENGQIFSGDENINIKFEYAGDYPCYVLVSGIGSVSVLEPVKNTVTISAGKLVNGKSYSIRISDGNVYSEVVEITIDADGTRYYNDIQNIINSVEYTDISQEEMFPDGIFTCAEDAQKVMTTIRVNVWRLRETVAETKESTDLDAEKASNDADGGEILNADDESANETEFEKYTDSISITVNNAVADKVKSIFAQLYELGFPIKSAAAYCWRDTHGNRLSEHAIGTAIDINPDENYCLYSDGSITGSLYAPGENPYSVTEDVIAVFKRYGFYWGGEWDSPKDYMHFSYYNT